MKRPGLPNQICHLRTIETLALLQIAQNLESNRQPRRRRYFLRHEIAALRYLRGEITRLNRCAGRKTPPNFSPILPSAQLYQHNRRLAQAA